MNIKFVSLQKQIACLMKKLFFILMLCMAVGTVEARKPKVKTQLFPDGTPIPAWFGDTSRVDVNLLGKRYALTDYGVKTDSNLVQTEAIQAVIDKAAAEVGEWSSFPKARSSVVLSSSSKARICWWKRAHD